MKNVRRRIKHHHKIIKDCEDYRLPNGDYYYNGWVHSEEVVIDETPRRKLMEDWFGNRYYLYPSGKKRICYPYKKGWCDRFMVYITRQHQENEHWGDVTLNWTEFNAKDTLLRDNNKTPLREFELLVFHNTSVGDLHAYLGLKCPPFTRDCTLRTAIADNGKIKLVLFELKDMAALPADMLPILEELTVLMPDTEVLVRLDTGVEIPPSPYVVSSCEFYYLYLSPRYSEKHGFYMQRVSSSKFLSGRLLDTIPRDLATPHLERQPCECRK